MLMLRTIEAHGITFLTSHPFLDEAFDYEEFKATQQANEAIFQEHFYVVMASSLYNTESAYRHFISKTNHLVTRAETQQRDKATSCCSFSTRVGNLQRQETMTGASLTRPG